MNAVANPRNILRIPAKPFLTAMMLSLVVTMTGLFSACNEADDITDGVSGNLVITVNDLGSLSQDDSTFTRTTQGSLSCSFQTGDQIGIYAWDGEDPVAINAPYTLTASGEWQGDVPVAYNSTYTYCAYYPYRADHGYTPATSGTADVRFAEFITDGGGKFWYADQHTEEAYRGSDLCIALGTHVGSHNLVTFSMAHKRSLAIIENAGSTSFTGENIPYRDGDECHFIMKAATATSFTGDGNTFSLTAAAGRHAIRDMKSFDYLTFTALEDGTFTLTIPAGVNTSYVTSVSYSLDDGESWTTTANSASNVTITTPTVTAGNKVLWKGTAVRFGIAENNYSRFSSTGSFAASGNIMSLLYGDSFSNQVSLSGKTYCFFGMFYNCTKLTAAPSFPATTLAQSCYADMFRGCTALTAMPTLPATTLGTYCYSYMFQGCTALTDVTYLPATSLQNYCYQYMFQGCTALTTAPALPAKTLASNCYLCMFQNCSSLNTVRAAFTTTPGAGTTNNWLSGVSASGTFYKNTAATWNVVNVHGVPSGWTIVKYVAP